MKRKASRDSKPTSRVVSAGGRFDRRDELLTTLRQGPELAAVARAGKVEQGKQSRWRLASIAAAVPWLQSYSVSGVWRVLQRANLGLRSAQVQQYSPDPDYLAKEAHLLACLRQTAQQPTTTVLLFLDEMGYYRWPQPAPVWGPTAPTTPPVADRQQSKQQQWRIIGGLNALTGQVDYLDGYVVGRAKVSAMYQQIVQRYAWADPIYVAQDNWSIHTHPEVLATVQAFPQLEPVWLPTYSPWLNPIEKLWRWLRQDVLHMHRCAAAWPYLQHCVNAFLDQFATGSQALLHYVGLAGDGKLAQAIQRY